jgi:predicted transglutaminase-like cysteine proteinase
MVTLATTTIPKSLALTAAIILLAAGLSGHSWAKGTQRPVRSKPVAVRLFGTVEFRSDLMALPQWLRVLSEAKRQIKDLTTCQSKECSPAAISWRQIIGLSKDGSPMEKIKAVNAFVNQWPYRLDIEAYGKTDYWASPGEFLKRSGDCEDYSIIKYFALKQMGFKAENMRIVVVKDIIRNIDHAILAVYIDQTAYVLDNLSNLILPHSRYRHYLPQYSINGVNRWAHIRPIGKQGF